MLNLPTFADRVWFAYHCLPRDSRGEPPQFKSLEVAHGLTIGTFSKVFQRGYEHLSAENMRALAAALRSSRTWLEVGGNDGPIPTGIVPPRPGLPWARHGELPGWPEAVALAMAVPLQRVPSEAYLAGADLPVYRPVERVTAELATAIATYAWETSTFAEQAKYSTQETRRAADVVTAKHRTSKTRPAARPIAK